MYDAAGNRTQVVTGVYPNNPPVAGLDTYSKAGASTSTLSVLDNDIDPDGQAVTITSVALPSAGGTASRINNTQISYTAGTVGTESFTYTIADGVGGTGTGTVSLTVTNTPRRPRTTATRNRQARRRRSPCSPTTPTRTIRR